MLSDHVAFIQGALPSFNERPQLSKWFLISMEYARSVEDRMVFDLDKS